MSGLNSVGLSDATSSCSSISTGRIIVCTEVFDDKSQPTDNEVEEYGKKIGINVENEHHLLHLAREGLLQKLPNEWKPCWDPSVSDYYYYNTNTGQSQWQHPLDEIYKQKVLDIRQKKFIEEDDIEETIEAPTELSGDTSDILTGSIQSKDEMNQKPPQKLAPLPPLGKKSLPPLKKLSPMMSPIKDKNESNKTSSDAKIKGILKSGDKSKNDWKDLRAQEVENDRRRIQFDLKKEVSKLQTDSNKSFSRGIIHQASVHLSESSQEESTDKDEDSDEDDFMTRHQLFDPEDLIVDDETLGDVDHLMQDNKLTAISTTKSSGEVNEISRPQTRLSKILSSVSTESSETTSAENLKTFNLSKPVLVNKTSSNKSEYPNNEDIVSKNDALSSVKLSPETLAVVNQKMSDIHERNQRSSSEIKQGLNGRLIESSYKNSEETKNKIDDYKEKVQHSLESEKKLIEEELRKGNEEDISELKETFIQMKKDEENYLRESLDKEIQRIRNNMQADLDSEKSRLVEKFDSEIADEIQRLEEDLKVTIVNKKKELENAMNKELDEYRENLLQWSEQKKKDIKNEIQSNAIASDDNDHSSKENYDTTFKMRINSASTSKENFTSEIKELSECIKSLQNQMKKNMIIKNDKNNEEKLEDFVEDELYDNNSGVSRNLRSSTSNLRKSRSNLNLDSEVDSTYDMSHTADLNKFIHNLQYRVQSLEKSLMPLTLPYQIPTVVPMPITPAFSGSVSNGILSSHVSPSRITNQNAWTVEEQIYQSKMWLKQRNQTMLSKP